MELLPVIESLRRKRSLFYSEADFQFALAWEIKDAKRSCNFEANTTSSGKTTVTWMLRVACSNMR